MFPGHRRAANSLSRGRSHRVVATSGSPSPSPQMAVRPTSAENRIEEPVQNSARHVAKHDSALARRLLSIQSRFTRHACASLDPVFRDAPASWEECGAAVARDGMATEQRAVRLLQRPCLFLRFLARYSSRFLSEPSPPFSLRQSAGATELRLVSTPNVSSWLR